MITYQELPADETDDASTLFYVSPQVEEILGYPMERWSEPGFSASIAEPDDLRGRGAKVARRRGRRHVPQRYRMSANDGRVVWFDDESP